MNNEQKSSTSSGARAQAKPREAIPCATIKLGLDVHADTIVVVRILDHSGPQPAQTFTPAKFLEWARAQLAQAAEVHSCYEAGPFGFVLHRRLEAMGIRNRVVQPVCLDERRTGVNHDKSDARELALRLDRLVCGNPNALAVVRVPTEEEERRRVTSRQREQLKREIQRVGAQGRALMLTQGFREKGKWWVGKRWEILEGRLPEWMREPMGRFRRMLEFLKEEQKAMDRGIGAEAAAEAPGPRPKGMGELSWAVIEREVGDWKRFGNRRQVGSYTGLCGGLSSSGASQRQLSITKHGNVRLRTALVELAWRMVRYQGQCVAVRKWERVLGNTRAGRGARKKAVVAIARQLAVDLWRWRTGRATPEALGWAMQGA